MNHRRVEQCVEKLCHKGCRSVWAVIDALESGETLAEVEGLSEAEIAEVVRELKSVMAVYRGTCATG